MEDSNSPEPGQENDVCSDGRLERLHFQRSLRSLELKAYKTLLEALRAEGKPNTDKEGLLKHVRDHLHIPDERHKAELRMVACNDELGLISRKLSGFEFSEEWYSQAQRIYIPLGPQAFSLYNSHPGGSTNTAKPLPTTKLKTGQKSDDESEIDTDTEAQLMESVINKHFVGNGLPLEKVKPIAIAVEYGMGNEQEMEEIEMQMKKKLKIPNKKQFSPVKSPDITEAPLTPTKINIKNESKPTAAVKGRGAKRKNSEDAYDYDIPLPPPPPPLEILESLTSKKIPVKPKNILKIKKPKSQSRPKIKILKRVEVKKAKESSEETSSADEGENGPIHLDESSRVMSPVFSEVIRSSVQARGRGRSLRGRGGPDRRRNNMATSPSKSKTGKPRPRTPNQKTPKTKNCIPTSGSRRKSKLNEKIDYDDVLMDLDGNEVGKISPYSSGDDASKRIIDHNDHDRLNDNHSSMKEYKSTDCAVYTEALPINFNHEDMEQVTDGVFKRPLPPSKGPKPWEINDARLSALEAIGDENNSRNNAYGESGIGHTSPEGSSQSNCVNDNSYPSPKSGEQINPHKKQRIKSPLIVNPNINPPNVSKVPLPAPVFSTTLNAASKKRHKPVSVVDSLNLHLPTSATASSLAASSSSRRPGASPGGGCSMFSNSSALIAGARGTAPGILQQQRKAHPHILANSKVHQRTFLPSVGSGISNNVSSTMIPISGTPVSIACATSTMSPNSVAASQTVQISNSSIPISAISSVAPSSLPFQSFPNSNSSSLNLASSSVPIGHVNRSAVGTNIIFVQKANGPTVSGSSTVPNNVFPIKTPPRAVILRRTQMPRQGNVMILDVQKNQIVGPGQVPPFLQTATRILNAPSELSLLNIQPNANQRKTTSSISNQPLSNSLIQTPPHTTVHKQDEETAQTVITESFNIPLSVNDQPEETPTIISTTSLDTSNTSQPDQIADDKIIENENSSSSVQSQEVSQDAQYAQIEAELMQMEEGNFEEVVYEEEVTTEIVPLEENENHQYIYSNDTGVTDSEIILSSHNMSSTSGSSTDTASEADTSMNNFELAEIDIRHSSVKKVTLSPTDEAKIASDAISRAISLSKSPAKRRIFSTSNISEAAVATKELPNRIYTTSNIQNNFTAMSLTELRLDSDSSTNAQIDHSAIVDGVEIVISQNDTEEQSQLLLQENLNAS